MARDTRRHRSGPKAGWAITRRELRRLLDDGDDDLDLRSSGEDSHSLHRYRPDCIPTNDEAYSQDLQGRARTGSRRPELVAVRIRESDTMNALVGAQDEWSARMGPRIWCDWVALPVVRINDRCLGAPSFGPYPRSPGENFTEPGLMSVCVSLIIVESFIADSVNSVNCSRPSAVTQTQQSQ